MSPLLDRSLHPSRWRFAAILIAGGAVLAPAGAMAKPAANLAGLDLRLEPSDVAPTPGPLVPEGPVTPQMHAQSTWEIVGEVDRVQKTETPNRRDAGSGPLGSLTAEEGLLEELLENKTIPLFRIRVAPPF